MLTLTEAIDRLETRLRDYAPNVLPDELQDAIDIVLLTNALEQERTATDMATTPAPGYETNVAEMSSEQVTVMQVLGLYPERGLPDLTDINLMNAQMVGTTGDTISVQIPKAVMTKDEALVQAAWLALLADDGHARFAAILAACANT